MLGKVVCFHKQNIQFLSQTVQQKYAINSAATKEHILKIKMVILILEGVKNSDMDVNVSV